MTFNVAQGGGRLGVKAAPLLSDRATGSILLRVLFSSRTFRFRPALPAKEGFQGRGLGAACVVSAS